ncbi:MAG: redox-active protein [Paludibacteraceae bacterium]|nr:redox-active protein [Paludibacteraceae bacterium]
MENERRKSETYFHAEPEKLNCAQSVLKGFQKDFSISDETIAEFRAWGGGRAKDGKCGALFAANYLMDKIGKDHLDDAFKAHVSYIKCADIKGNKASSCANCVHVADELISKELEK